MEGKKKRLKMKIKRASVSWRTTSGNQLYITAVPQRRQETEKFEERMAKDFPNLIKIINPTVLRCSINPNTKKMKKTMLRHINIKLLYSNEKGNS